MRVPLELDAALQGAGFRVQGSGFRVQGSGFRVQGAGCRVQGSESTCSVPYTESMATSALHACRAP